jgi:hypothetical protein
VSDETSIPHVAEDDDGPSDLVRDILESLCRRDGISLDSAVEPGEPARNYELAMRLGIGHVFGIREQS